MTPASLLRRLLVGRLAERWEDPRIVRIGDRPVLEAVAALIASSDEPGIYRPDPELDGIGSLAEKVSRKMRAVGAEEEIAAAIERLTRLGFLLIYPDSAMRLALPDKRQAGNAIRAEDLTSKDIAGKYTGLFTIGSPRANEADDSYKQRQALKRATVEREIADKVGTQAEGETLDAYRRRVLEVFGKLGAPKSTPVRQGSFLLTQTGGRATGEPLRPVELADHLRRQFHVPGTEPNRTQAEPKEIGQTEAVGLSSVDRPRTAAAADSLGLFDSNPTAAASLTAACEAKPNLQGNPNPKVEPNPPPEPRPLSAEALRLAGIASAKFNYDLAAKKKAPVFMQTYLDGGDTPAAIEAAIEQSGPNQTAAYIEHRLHKGREALKRGNGSSGHNLSPSAATAAAPTVPPKPMHAKIKEYGWDLCDAERRAKLNTFLCAMDIEDPAHRSRVIRRFQGLWMPEYEMVLRKHRELRQMGEGFSQAEWDARKTG